MHGVLALFIRSLRENIRGASFAWMRAGMATVVLLTLFWFKGMDQLGAGGVAFFQPFAVYNAAMIAIAAMSYFASAITEEKEEQTLGLLRMTDLSVLAILFGKSTSRILSGLMLLAVQFPFALLAITLGGMTWEQIAITYALLCAFLIFTANLGLLASVLVPTGGKAGVLTGVIGFFYLFPQPLFAVIGWFRRHLSEDGYRYVGEKWEDYTGPSANAWLLDVALKYPFYILPFAAIILAVVSGPTFTPTPFWTSKRWGPRKRRSRVRCSACSPPWNRDCAGCRTRRAWLRRTGSGCSSTPASP